LTFGASIRCTCQGSCCRWATGTKRPNTRCSCSSRGPGGSIWCPSVFNAAMRCWCHWLAARTSCSSLTMFGTGRPATGWVGTISYSSSPTAAIPAVRARPAKPRKAVYLALRPRFPELPAPGGAVYLVHTSGRFWCTSRMGDTKGERKINDFKGLQVAQSGWLSIPLGTPPKPAGHSRLDTEVGRRPSFSRLRWTGSS
jgi:hypothetical protein